MLSEELIHLKHRHFDSVLLQLNPLFRLPSGQEGIEHIPAMNQIREFDEDTSENKLKKNEVELYEVTKNHIMTSWNMRISLRMQLRLVCLGKSYS